MKAIKLIFVFLLLGAAGSGNVWADRGHHHSHFGVTIAPYWGPWYNPPPPPYFYPRYYYAPPVVIERQVPQVYIEQQPAPVVQAPAAAAMTPPTSYWYYCVASRAYYPYVKECPGGWQKVLPQPPDQH